MAVVRHGSTAAIGKVVDIYDGTGVARLQFSQLGGRLGCIQPLCTDDST